MRPRKPLTAVISLHKSRPLTSTTLFGNELKRTLRRGQGRHDVGKRSGGFRQQDGQDGRQDEGNHARRPPSLSLAGVKCHQAEKHKYERRQIKQRYHLLAWRRRNHAENSIFWKQEIFGHGGATQQNRPDDGRQPAPTN